MFNINSTGSLFNKAVHTVEKKVDAVEDEVIHAIKSESEHIATTIEKDTSRLVHTLSVNTLSTGKDITIRFDNTVGETKRIVINGELTVEKLITHLRGLA